LLLLRAVAALAAAVPGAVIRLPAPGAGAVIAYAAGLGGALAAWRWRARRGPCRTLAAGATLALLTAAALAALPILTRGDGRLRAAGAGRSRRPGRPAQRPRDDAARGDGTGERAAGLGRRGGGRARPARGSHPARRDGAQGWPSRRRHVQYRAVPRRRPAHGG